MGKKVELPPAVKIFSPTNGMEFWPGSNITFSAEARDMDGSISTVKFYRGQEQVGFDISPPYSVELRNLDPGTWVLTAKATDNFGETAISESIEITVKPRPAETLSPPSLKGPGVTDRNRNFEIDTLYPMFLWNEVSGASGYEIEITDLTALSIFSYSAPRDSFYKLTEKVLQRGKQYSWRMESIAPDGSKSQPSNMLYFRIQDASDTVPPVISDVRVAGLSQSGATITWTTDKESTSQVEYGQTTAFGFSSSLDKTLVKTHSSVLSGLKPATDYHFRVKSKNPSNYETVSNGSFKTSAPTLSLGEFTSPLKAIPEWDSSSAAGPGIRLTWGATLGAESYEVFRDRGLIAKVKSTVFFNNSGLASGKSYAYFVRAKNSASSRDSNPVTAVAPNQPVPNPPTTIGPGTTTDSGKTVSNLTPTFSWQPVNNAAGYGLYLANGSLARNIFYIRTDLKGSSFTLPKGILAPGGNYQWFLTCFVKGVQSDMSAWRFFRAPAGGDDQYEQNDDFASSKVLSTGLFVDLECNDEDWYKINVPKAGKTLRSLISFKNANGNLEMELFNANGNYLKGSYSGSDVEDIKFIVPAAGYYHVKVYGHNGAKGRYDLSFGVY